MLKIIQKIIFITILTASLFLLFLNVRSFIQSLTTQKTRVHSLIKPGVQFVTLEEKTKGQRFIGYLTDKNMAPDGETMSFLQAQNLFAPSILLEGDTTQEFTLFDFKDLNNLKKALYSIGRGKVHRTLFNRVLIERPAQ